MTHIHFIQSVPRDLRHSGAYQSYAGVLLAPLSSTCLNSAMADKSGSKPE